MNRYRTLVLLSVLSLSTFPLVGCSNSSSPTEPALDDTAAVTDSLSVTQESRGRGRGGDDPAGDDRGGRGRRGGRDDRPQAPRAGQEFEAAVTAVNGQTLTLANGIRVVVNAQTQWSNRGDLFNLSQVARAVAAGRPARVEGRGTRQANGTFVAQTIKAEVDD